MKSLSLAKDHWRGFSTRNAHMVNIANSIRFKMVYAFKNTERKKKRIFCISKRRIYIENIIFLHISNSYPLIPTLQFVNKFLYFCWWRVLFAMTSFPLTGVHWLYVTETIARKQITFEVMNRWIIIRLKDVSLITNNDNSWPTFPACKIFRWHE